jgi:hypothetical protein
MRVSWRRIVLSLSGLLVIAMGAMNCVPANDPQTGKTEQAQAVAAPVCSPACADYALWLQMCQYSQIGNQPIVIGGVSITAANNCPNFGTGVPAGGTCTQNNLPDPWPAILTSIANCARPPVCVGADGNPVLPPQWQPGAPPVGHTFNFVCTAGGTACPGQNQCILVDTTNGACAIVAPPYCSGMNNACYVFPGYPGYTGPTPSPGSPNCNWAPSLPDVSTIMGFYCPNGGSFDWGVPQVYYGAYPNNCNQPVPTPQQAGIPGAPPGPLLSCNYDITTNYGSYQQACCVQCQATPGAQGSSTWCPYSCTWWGLGCGNCRCSCF